MRDTATDSERSERRAGRNRLAAICVAFVASQIIVVAVVPPRERGVTAGLLTMVTIVAVIVTAIETGFERAAVRAAEAGAPIAEPPRRPRERVSPLIQRAYYLAQRDAPAWHIAGRCEIPEAFAVLIIDDVRRTAARKGRAARNSSGTDSGGQRPENPPAT